MDCGKRLKELIDHKKVNQAWLAKQLDVDENTLSGWTYKSSLHVHKIQQICEVFKMPLYEFFISEQDIKTIFDLPPSLLEVCQRIYRLPEQQQNVVLQSVYSCLMLAEKNDQGVQ